MTPTAQDDAQNNRAGIAVNAPRYEASLYRRVRLVGLLILAAVAVAMVASVAALRIWWLSDSSDGQRSQGVNALWAAHTWVGDAHSDSEYQHFAELLRSHEISDVFVHAGPLDGEGSVPSDRIRYARTFTAAMARYAPTIRVQAYLGQIEKRGNGPLDLGNPATRSRIVITAEQMIELGFEGIHYDIEPIYPGEQGFLDLLEQTHELTRARGVVLSVALEQLEIVPGAQRVVSAFLPAYHDPTRAFLQDVARDVDQVAIMTYDTGLPTDWLFGAYMAWQTRQVVGVIGHDVTVFMGVPTYDSGSFWRFHPSAENMRSGVRGVRKGLDGLSRDDTRNVGIAIFAEWTTDDAEWSTFSSDWLRR